MLWPYFAELGKDVKGIFNHGYNTGLFILGVSSKTPTEVEISSNVATNLDTYNASGSVQTKYKTKCGTFVMKLDTDNKFFTEMSFTDMFGKGTRLSLEGGLAPQDGYKSFHARSFYANEMCSFSADLDTNVVSSTLSASVVSGYSYYWVSGIQVMFDLNKRKLSGSSVAIAYLADDFSFHSAYNNGNEVTGSIYQKVNSKLDIGIQIATSSHASESQLDLGCRYKVDPETTAYAKVDSRGEFGIGYEQKIHEGVTFCLSSQCKLRDSSGGGCKLGFALNFHL